MDLPSMVQRSGNTLIVRSVVSGNQLFMDQATTKPTANTNSNSSNNNNNNMNNGNGSSADLQQHHTSVLEQQLERYRAAAAAVVQQQQRFLQQSNQNPINSHHHQHHHHNQQQQATDGSTNVPTSSEIETKEDGLPQCKIKRNYSCSYCTYFTQNPRSHLTHLRDVHGEKIVINKCELCLYASRHFQKLVRHMKMVHGCTDGLPGAHGQPRGKRGMSREARKRKLEQSVGLNIRGSEMPSIEQVKREMQLQEQKMQAMQAAQQQEQQKQQQQQQQLANSAAEALFRATYEQQLQKAQHEHELELEALQQTAASHHRHNHHHQRRQSSTSPDFPIPPAHQQRASPATSSRQLELSSSSPTGSTSPTTTTTATTYASPNAGHGEMEQPQNRLIKCSVCDFTTLYREQLMEHEVEEHCKTKFFRCEKCSYVTHIKARFSKHVKYHSMPMIKCVACDFRTPYKWNLDRHMKNHGGAGPFKCAACDFTADIKQSLTVHEMNHHVPPVGHAAGMSLARRRNKVGGTDLSDDFLSDSAEMLEDHYNNNNLDDYDDVLVIADDDKKDKYTDEEPTDLSQKGGSSDTSSVHNQAAATSKPKRPVPNLIPISKSIDSALNLSKNLTGSRSSLIASDIASMFFTDKVLNEMLQPFDKSDAAQLSPTTTIASASSHNSRSLLRRPASAAAGSFFDKLKSSAFASAGPNGNLVCPCGHVAKCLSESIIHRKSCNLATLAVDDDLDDLEGDDCDGGRLEIDFVDEDDKQSHSALNLSVTGSTRCQHCRHRCKSSADLLAHMRHCPEANRFGNESYDSMSGESNAGGGRSAGDLSADSAHPMENRVFVWNKPQGSAQGGKDENGGNKTAGGNSRGTNLNNEENSYYGVETAPGYGEVTKKMTPEEEAANSSLKKVYKCPHCSFWASTASRFHVHIVGHLNKKPFECSLCSYRSNWRWDITKHIRLKTIRDPSHKNARVLMNDETGRRNYTKYNKYITLMKVTEEDGDPKLMKSGEMTPHQVASLAFYNDSKNAGIAVSGSAGANAGTTTANGLLNVQLNGLKEDITLEPILNVKTGDNQLNADDIIRLPFLPTIVNAAMAQQQHQHQNDEGHATLITPSVTISAVKRTPSMMAKASDDLIIDISQEGNDKKTYYNCRKCSFRHSNRDAALAHVKIHYQDANFPIVTATPMPAPKSLSNNSSNTKQQNPAAMQVGVNQSSINVNKFLAAMGFPQSTSANSAATTANNNDQQQHSLLSAGLLQQAMQAAVAAAVAATPNSPLSGLALALAGQSPTKLAAAASILEHGEQKANPNEASAQYQLSSPKKSKFAAGGSGDGVGGGGNCNVDSSKPSTTPPATNNSTSLQYLLSSPLATYNINKTATTTATTTTATSTTFNKDDNLGVGNVSNNLAVGATTATSTTATNPSSSFTSSPSLLLLATAANCDVPQDTIVTTTTSTTASAANPLSLASSSNLISGVIGRTGESVLCIGGYGASSFNSNNNNNNDNDLLNDNNNHIAANNLKNTSSAFTRKLSSLQNSAFSNSNSTNQKFSLNQTNEHLLALSSSPSLEASLSSSSSSLLMATTAAKCASASRVSSAATTTTAAAATAPTTTATTTNLNSNLCNSSSKTNNNNNVLSLNSGERRNPNVDPSPYRCGHCHQVSNWKHVIQRHCRLKHNADVRIETLDRAATNSNERDAPPVYRALGNNSSSNSNSNNNNSAHAAEPSPAYAMAIKSLQQQVFNKSSNSNNNNNNTNNNKTNANSVLMNATEQLLHSPLAASAAVAAAAAANAATTQQDLNAAAAAYLAAAFRAATTGVTAEELLLQQQLQQNDQIEITRLPPPAPQSQQATSNLAQLLETVNQQQQQQQQSSALNQNAQNSKSKQQQCPLCPYISESKSQMNYHISLHKPTQYECQLCPFVCAKKQHLSSHMRSIHHQFNATTNNNAGNVNNTASLVGNAANGPSLDFCVALQLAAAAQQPQQDSSSKRSPLTIDVSALKSPTSVEIKQELSGASDIADQQYKQILYCSKCPARFAQKLHEAQNAKAELKEHLKCHGGVPLLSNEDDEESKFKCEFCDYHAAHETLIQAHRHVHTPLYQEKCNELYKNCKDDAEYAAPKLMQITLTAKSAKTIWIVDNELSNELFLKDEQQQQQRSSSTSSKYIGSSLLKKQLESGQQALGNHENPTKHRNNEQANQQVANAECDESSSSNTLPSTTSGASVATSDLAAADDTRSNATSTPTTLMERCLHCPFETTDAAHYKAHLKQHICVSNKKAAHTCDHCDFSVDERSAIVEHTRVHFNAMEKLKSVAFFTSYDNLELSVEQNNNNDDDDDGDAEDDGETSVDQQATQNREHENLAAAANQTKTAIENVEATEEMPFIKQELDQEPHNNNNNEDDAVNENILKSANEQKLEKFNEMADKTDNDDAPPPAKKPCTKIILYKNDGHLSIKKDATATAAATTTAGGICESISERLRRRISRSANQSQSNGFHHHHGGQQQQQRQQDQLEPDTTNQKAILVNAKTGEVLKKH